MESISNDYLVHHGILGQKWGIRRYQNPDGTLTEAGRKRRNKYIEKELKRVDDRYDKGYRYGFYFLQKKQGIDRMTKNSENYKIEAQKFKEIGDDVSSKEYYEKYKKEKINIKINEELKKLEKMRVSELTNEQITNEHKKIASEYIIKLSATAVVNAIIPGPAIVVLNTPGTIKSKMRISDYEREQIENKVTEREQYGEQKENRSGIDRNRRKN